MLSAQNLCSKLVSQQFKFNCITLNGTTAFQPVIATFARYPPYRPDGFPWRLAETSTDTARRVAFHASP